MLKRNNLPNYAYRYALNFGYENPTINLDNIENSVKFKNLIKKIVEYPSKHLSSLQTKYLPALDNEFVIIAIKEGQYQAEHDLDNEQYDIYDFEHSRIKTGTRKLLQTSSYDKLIPRSKHGDDFADLGLIQRLKLMFVSAWHKIIGR